jgi:multiple sugar transport system permease protein
MGYACAMAWILFILTLIASLIVFKTSARWVYYEGGDR